MNSSPALSLLLRNLRSAQRSPWAWGALALAVFTAILNSIPPFRDIHYELSGASALALSLLPCGIVALRRQRPEPVSLERDVTRTLLLSLVPLLTALVALPFRNDVCLGDGPLWYLLLAPSSALISLALGRVAEAAVPQRRWLRLLLVLLLWGGSLGRGLWEALTGPHIFLYCWQIGFFPGGSWDPFIPIPDRLIIYRAAHILVAVGLLAVAELWRERNRDTLPARRHLRPLIAGAAVLAVIVPLALGFRVRLGLSSTDAWVEEQLGDAIRTRWSVVITNRTAVDSLTLNAMLLEIDRDVEEYAELLQTRPEVFAPVRVVLYPNAAERERLVGSRWVAYTKPWRGEMHIIPQSRGVLRHELGHLAMAPFGNPLGITLAQGLLEGSAEALGGEWGIWPLETYAAMMERYKTAPNPVALMTVGGFTGSTSASYVASGAFCRWLIEQYGGRRFTEVFAWGDFDKVYGIPLDSLAGRYERHLDSISHAVIDQINPATMSYLFGGGGFFQQRCLRALGALNAQADAAFAAGRYTSAIELANAAMELGGSNATRATTIRALGAMGQYGKIVDSLKRYVVLDSANSFAVELPSPLLPLNVEFGDALWRIGEPKKASDLYRRVAGFQLSTSLTVRALTRLVSIDCVPPALRDRMLLYFTTTASTTRRVAWLSDLAAANNDEEFAVILRLLRAQLLVNESPVGTIQQLIDDGTLHRAHVLASDLAITPCSTALEQLTETLLVELAPAILLHDRLAPSERSAWEIVAPILRRSQVPSVQHLNALRN